MAHTTLWWLMAGAAVVLELVTGTFYLLMLAIGLAAAAVTAHAGGGLIAQLLVAALVGGGAVAGWHLHRGRRPAGPPAGSNKDVNLDVGETVQVEAWHADGTASVRYRGAQWSAVAAAPDMLQPGPHRVREVVGSRLVLEKF